MRLCFVQHPANGDERWWGLVARSISRNFCWDRATFGERGS